MVKTKTESRKYWAQCPICGRWQEVQPQPGITDCYFLNLEADFTCCQVKHRARFAVEKDYEYFQG